MARTVVLITGTALLSVAATLGVLYVTGAFTVQSLQSEETPQQETRQEEVAERGTQVMPFDLEKTTHVFETRENGGVESITADDPEDEEQISLIRWHLQEEASNFSEGDFSDPAEIHGQDMPGLTELQAGADRIEFRYSELPDGARIEYVTGDPALVYALHEWFAAQGSDHGDDASSEGEHSSHH